MRGNVLIKYSEETMDEIDELLRIEEEDQRHDESSESALSAIKKQDEDNYRLYMQNLGKKGAEASRRARAERHSRIVEIRNNAFDQKLISLEKPIPKDQLQRIIELLSEKRLGYIKNQKKFIDARIAYCLNPLIPKKLKQCFKEYPKSILIQPSFTYVASEEYGGGEHCIVNPIIPYYFECGTEMDALYKHKAVYIYAIDKAVLGHNTHIRKLREEQVTYANKLATMREQTYYGLLKEHPLWFELLYNDIKNKSND